MIWLGIILGSIALVGLGISPLLIERGHWTKGRHRA